MQYLNNRNVVEDLVQDFFVSLWEQAPDLQINLSLKSYLFAGIRNRCLDYLKHQKVVEKFRTHILFSAEGIDNPAEHYFAESELRCAIERSMQKLSPRCREIFELSRLNGLSNKEIADHLGISIRTVELQICNSLKILRKGLSEYFPIWLIAWLLR
jgi:RNA polymerase sigma-70 factor (ECF subfamily)